jgi:hypothetical protein
VVELSGGSQVDFETACRNLGGCGVPIRAIREACDLVYVPISNEFLEVRIGEALFVNLGWSAQVPEIASIERKPERVPFTPEQPAKQPVSQGDGFIPSRNRRFEDQVKVFAG